MANEEMISTNDLIELLQRESDFTVAQQLFAYTKMVDAQEGRTAAIREAMVKHCLDVEVRGEKIDPVHQFAYGILCLSGMYS